MWGTGSIGSQSVPFATDRRMPHANFHLRGLDNIGVELLYLQKKTKS